MTDDPIQAEAERLYRKHAEGRWTPEQFRAEIAAALRRQREEGRKEAGRRWQTDAYKRGLEDGAREERRAADDLLMDAWGVIANAGGGNWTLEKPDWRAAAVAWRDRWHRRLREAE